MAANPLLTVFMPVYNTAEYLPTAIESILSQTFGDFEFIIVDDGSTDHSVEVIRSYRDSRMRLIQQENQGCYHARNRAIAEARGTYLANMDADDISLPERLEKQVDYLERNSAAAVVGTLSLGCDRNDTTRLKQPLKLTYASNLTTPHLLKVDASRAPTLFTCATVLFRAEFVRQTGPYDTRLCYSADVEFVLRAAAMGMAGCLPEYLYVFRLLPHAISGAGSHIQREILEIISAAQSRASKPGERSYTDAEILRLAELAEARHRLPRVSARRKQAYYETRLGTLLRVNGCFQRALRHSLKAALMAPEHLLLDRKLVSNLCHSGLGLLKETLGKTGL